MGDLQDPIDWRYLPYKKGLYKAYVIEYNHKIWPYMVSMGISGS
jgi:hypothetical protein